MYRTGDHLDIHHGPRAAPVAGEAASFTAIDPAILNAISLESTSW